MLSLLLATAVLAQIVTAAVQTLSSGSQCLQVTGTPANGSPVTLGECNSANAQMGSTGQQWIISPGNNPAVQLFGTGLCLDAGPNPTPGRASTVATCQGSVTQAWYLTGDNRVAVTGGNQCLEAAGTIAQTGNCGPGITSQAWTPAFLFDTPTSSSGSAAASSSASASSSSSGASGAGGVVGGVTQSASSATSAINSAVSSTVPSASSGASGASSAGASITSGASSVASGASSAVSGPSSAGGSVVSGASSAGGSITSGGGSVAGAATSGAGSVAGGATSVVGSVAGAASSAVTPGNSAGFAQRQLPYFTIIMGVVFGAVYLF